MNKKEIIELFLKNGVLISPDELERINSENCTAILEAKTGGTKNEFTVNEPRRGRISSEEFIRACNSKFDFLRDTLLKKIDAVSINKGKKIFSEVAVIGRVKESTAKGFVVEDLTGETEVIGENKEINAGDVLGVIGFFKDNSLFAKQIVWPDIPLEHSPKPIRMKITLTTKVKEDMGGLVICPNAEKSKNVISGFGKIGMIRISKDGHDIRIIAYSPGNKVSEEEAVRILKKRLLPEEEVLDNAITEIPDIFWLPGNNENWARNYRGVVIISSGEGSFAEYGADGVKFGKI